MRRDRTLTWVLGATVTLVSCQLVFPTKLLDAPPSVEGDSGAEPDTASAPSPEGGCVPAHPPPPPLQNSPAGPDQTFTATMKEIAFEDKADAGETLGLDLDGVCTCPGAPSCTSAKVACDGVGGQDRNGNGLLSSIDALFGSSAEGKLNERILAGRVGIVLWVSAYNGGADDTSVLVSLLLSKGIILDADAGTFTTPRWDGHDAWNIDPASAAGYRVVDGKYVYVPKTLATVGYVTKGTLVAALPVAQLDLGASIVTVHDARIVATLRRDPSGYRLEGQISARVRTDNLLAATAGLRDPTDTTRFMCGDAPTFLTFRQAVCGLADLNVDPEQDRKNAPCNAVSVALGFRAFSAETGAPFAGAGSRVGCDGGVRGCSDP